MHEVVIYHTMHHTHSNMLQCETLDLLKILLKPTSKVQVLRDLFQSHTEILYEQNTLLVVSLLL